MTGKRQPWLPLLGQLRGYGTAALRADVVAGAVVGLLVIPQALAYATLAEMPAVTGLYAAFFALVLYGLLGSSPQLSVGPVALVCLMTASAIHNHPDAEPGAVAAHLGLLCGVMLLLLRVFRFGAVVNLLSHPVLVGFVNGAVVLILLSQVPVLLGVATPAELAGAAAGLWALTQPGAIDRDTLGIALFGAFVLGATRLPEALPRRLRPRWGAPLRRLGPALLLLLTLGIAAQGPPFESVARVGPLPTGLPPLQLDGWDWRLGRDLLAEAAAIAVIVFVESFSLGASLAHRRQARLAPEPEFVALGVANLGTALVGGFPVAGSFSRSAANDASGAVSTLSSVFAAVIVCLCLLLAAPLIALLPLSLLGVIVAYTVLPLLDFSQTREWQRFNPPDLWVFAATFLAVLVLGVEAGLAVGVMLSIAGLVQRSSRPHMAVVGRVNGSDQFRSVRRHETQTLPGIAAIRIDESLYFTNVRAIEQFVLETVAAQQGLRHVLFVCTGINHIDSSGLAFLRRLIAALARRGVLVHLADVKWPVMAQLRRTDFVEALSGEVFFSTKEAVEALQEC